MNNLMKCYMQYARGEKNSTIFNVMFAPFALMSSVIISSMDFLRRHGIMKVEEPPLPLISVGNLTYGGTNKTPFVEMLAKFALSRNIKAGIVTRGYTGKSHDVILIRNGEGRRELTGDEPLLLSRELPEVPVAVAKHRIAGVRALREAGAELVIADDAFQHKQLGRDVDIVLIDAICPFGNNKLMPAGIMREKTESLHRADVIVLTKSDQVAPEELNALREHVKNYADESRIFTSRIDADGWILRGVSEAPKAGGRVFAFSAIGSPESFSRSIRSAGLFMTCHKKFSDHHAYSQRDLEKVYSLAKKNNADFIMCTEKDLYNFPENYEWSFDIPLAIPKVKAVVNETEKFFALLTELLQPHIVVASNGYGEDAIGVVLAKKLRAKFPLSDVAAFPLVGRGEAYSREGFAVKSAPSVTPSGGVLKYSFRDLWGDMRAGLLKHIRSQLQDWRKISGKIRTPICVGDVYLLLNTLWGSGKRPLFAATAKTVYLSGHWRSERVIINKFTLRTWTRDKKSAEQLGGNAVFSGSPIMDLLCENGAEYVRGDVVLLLPGSRQRACNDVKLLLDAVEIMSAGGEGVFRMVLAPTLPFDDFFAACESYGWRKCSDTLTKNNITISLTYEPVARAVDGVKILLGLGGTANQLCAGLGIPVISIDEKGKRVQKKLLGDSEILTEANGAALAECALRVLGDKELYEFMSRAGRERMGQPGALDDIVSYTCDVLGWNIREEVFGKLKKY